jgi:hypothetical protein
MENEDAEEEPIESMESIQILSIKRALEGWLEVAIDEDEEEAVAWKMSTDLLTALIKECKDHLGGEFSEEFDPTIIRAIKQLEDEWDITTGEEDTENDIDGSHKDEPPRLLS